DGLVHDRHHALRVDPVDTRLCLRARKRRLRIRIAEVDVAVATEGEIVRRIEAGTHVLAGDGRERLARHVQSGHIARRVPRSDDGTHCVDGQTVRAGFRYEYFLGRAGD